MLPWNHFLSTVNSYLLLLSGCVFSAGGFPTQVVICDLKSDGMMRGIVLSERHDIVGLHSTLSDHGAATVHARSSQHD